MSFWTIAWLLWGAAFFAIELPALRRTPNGRGTLSAHFWRVLKVDDPRPTALIWVLRVLLLLAMAVLALHLAFGWFTPTDPWPFDAPEKALRKS